MDEWLDAGRRCTNCACCAIDNRTRALQCPLPVSALAASTPDARRGGTECASGCASRRRRAGAAAGQTGRMLQLQRQTFWFGCRAWKRRRLNFAHAQQTGLPRGRRLQSAAAKSQAGRERSVEPFDLLAEPGRSSLRLEPRLFSDPDTSSRDQDFPSPACSAPQLTPSSTRCDTSGRPPASWPGTPDITACSLLPSPALPACPPARSRELSFVTGLQQHCDPLRASWHEPEHARKLARFGRLCAGAFSCDSSSLCSPAMTRIVNTTRCLPTEPGPRAARCGRRHYASRLFGAPQLPFCTQPHSNRLSPAEVTAERRH